MDTLIQDLRYALRQLRRSPGFAAVAILTLALGIGANTAIFSVLDAALLRPLPVEEPYELVHLRTQRPEGAVNASLSYPLFDAIRDRTRSLSGTLAMAEWTVSLGTEAEALRARGEFVSGGYFDLLGIEPALGRLFRAPETEAGAPVAVLGHRTWRARFGGDPRVVGATVELNGHPFTVIGVGPRGFPGLVRGQVADFWAPLRAYPLVVTTRFDDAEAAFGEPGIFWLNVIGRLAPGASLERARAEMAALDRGLREAGLRSEVEAGRVDPIGTGLGWSVASLETPLALLMVVVGVVLLIACANVAGLFLARAASRRREMAVRRSLGAGPGRLARQLLTESVVVAAAGGTAGLLFAGWLAPVLASYRPPGGDALALSVSLDARVLGFTAAVSLVTALLFGIAPALAASREALVPALKQDARAGPDAERRYGLRHALVAAQVCLSLVLLVGAGLLLQSVRNLRAVDLAFDPANVLLLEADLGARDREPAERRAFQRAALERVRSLPGVESAAWASVVHPNPGGSRVEGVELEDAPGVPDAGAAFDVSVVSTGYFETLRMPLLRGRGFTADDDRDAPRVAVVNRAMAERYWPGRDPVGRQVYLGPREDPAGAVRIVGIAPDTRYRDLREREGHVVYLPLAQSDEPKVTLLARTAGPPSGLAAAVRAEIRALAPGVPLFGARSLEEHLRGAYAAERLAAQLTAAFGLLALTLAAVGLYGTLSFFVARRTREIGIRIALGAEPRDVVGYVLRGAALVVAVGLVLGVLAALLLSPLARGILYQAEPGDPGTILLACATLGAVALLAAWLPARRASRLEPARTLREE